MKDIIVFVGVLITLLLIVCFMQGCVSITIPDSEWCGDMGPQGAACFHTLAQTERDVPKAQWDLEREGMICTQSSTFASWKATIEKLCHDDSSCNYQAVSAFLDKASTLRRHP